jgi:hypothetical protein
MLNPKTASTFREYVAAVFIPYVTSQLQSAQRIDIIWDTYKDDSLKSCTRDRRGSRARRRVALSVKIPPNWKSFLRVNENKTELFRFLAEEDTAIHKQGKEVYSTYGNDVLSNTDRTTMYGLQPCNHEEADSRIFLHVHNAALQHHRVLIRAVDTDVFILAVAQMQRIPDKELWLAFGTGKQFRYLPIHDIVRSLVPERSLALPVFHALTGCDTVSFFGGKSKKRAWDTWNLFPEVTHSFLEIATAPDKLSNKCTQTIERFVVLLYDCGSQLSSVDDARQQCSANVLEALIAFLLRLLLLGNTSCVQRIKSSCVESGSYGITSTTKSIGVGMEEGRALETCVDDPSPSAAKLL